MSQLNCDAIDKVIKRSCSALLACCMSQLNCDAIDKVIKL